MTNTFEPFNDINVRKAIAMGIDRQRIVDFFYPEGSEVASHFTPAPLKMAALAKIGMNLILKVPKLY